MAKRNFMDEQIDIILTFIFVIFLLKSYLDATQHRRT